jgi:hypothetical protein
MSESILLVGGYGVLGAQLARTLRRRHPDLHLTIAGRDLAKAEAAASTLGNAVAAQVDVDNLDGRLEAGDFSAIALLVKDESLGLTDIAGRKGIPLLTLSSAAFEIGPEMAHGLRAAKRAPIVLASLWFTGAPAIVALDLASRLDSVDLIEIGVVVDASEAGGGPATLTDFQRIARTCPSTLVRKGGRYVWVDGQAAQATFEREDGSTAKGTIAVAYDVMCLGAATGAPTIRVIQAFVPSLSSQSGGGAADEISIRVAGRTAAGEQRALRRHIVAPREPVSLTTLTVTLAIERLLGRMGGSPVQPGLFTMDNIFAPADFVTALADGGARLSPVVEGRQPAES